MSKTELGHVYALEGLDGTGKTESGKLLAIQTNSAYHYCMDGNPLRLYRRFFDQSPIPVRFLYYLGVSIETYRKAERLRTLSDVYVDRSIASTIAYHKAYGISDRWLSLIPNALNEQINLMIYFTASEDTRRKRILDRIGDGQQTLSHHDQKSLLLGGKVDTEYRKVFPTKTLIISTEGKNPRQIAEEVKERLYEKAN